MQNLGENGAVNVITDFFDPLLDDGGGTDNECCLDFAGNVLFKFALVMLLYG